MLGIHWGEWAFTSCPQGMWDLSSPTRDETWVPCIGRQILNHWTTRKSLFSSYIDYTGFPVSSAGKESTCNGGDSGSIPGSESSLGEGIGYQLQYSWASLVVQMVKNPPTMQEAWVWCLGWEGPLEGDMATHSSILAWRIPKVTKSWTWLSD